MNPNQIKEAFNQIHADDRLKDSTKVFLSKAMEKKQEKHSFFPRKLAYAAAVCLVICLAGVGGFRLYFTPTSIISIDVNPSIELNINRFNKVVKVSSYNQDGEDFAQSLDILYKDYEQAVEDILESDTITDCLARNELLSVAVVEFDNDQGTAILDYVSQCTAGQENTYCYGVNSEEVSQAHALGLSYGKYKVYAEIQTYTTDLTPEQANSMTMRELRDLLSELQSGEDASSPSAKNDTQHGGSGNGPGQGQGNGQGNGTGSGNGNHAGNSTGTSSGSSSGNGGGNGSGSGTGNKNGSGNGTGAGMGLGKGSGQGQGQGNGMGSGNKGKKAS